jgi:hypothetical protein
MSSGSSPATPSAAGRWTPEASALQQYTPTHRRAQITEDDARTSLSRRTNKKKF